MELAEVLSTLETLGTDQNRKVYARHGVNETQYGVSYANLEMLRKKIKTNTSLGIALWNSGIHDARILATKILDAPQLTREQLEAWAGEIKNQVTAEALADVVVKSPYAWDLTKLWVQQEAEYPSCIGWITLAKLALQDVEQKDDVFAHYLPHIEQHIHQAPNRTREAMNNALIAIGIRSEALAQAATATAGRIGKVKVDHGDTSCKTPEAAAYIAKARARKQNAVMR